MGLVGCVLCCRPQSHCVACSLILCCFEFVHVYGSNNGLSGIMVHVKCLLPILFVV